MSDVSKTSGCTNNGLANEQNGLIVNNYRGINYKESIMPATGNDKPSELGQIALETDNSIINKHILSLYEYAHSSDTNYLAIAENELNIDDGTRTKLLMILNIFLLYYKPPLRDYISNCSKIALILSLYYYIIFYIKLKVYTSSVYTPPGFPILGIDTGRGIKDHINIATKHLSDILGNINQEDIYRLNIQFINALIYAYEDTHNKLNEYMNLANSVNEQLKDMEAKWKLSSFAGEFAKIAKSESNAKWFWLILSFMLGIGGLSILGYNIHSIVFGNFNITMSESIIRIFSTILLFILTIWCSKIYSVARTQEITYRHIATVLNVYNMVKDSTQDNTEKNIIMTEMAHTIFSRPILPNTKMVENNELPQIIEIVKLLLDKDKN